MAITQPSTFLKAKPISALSFKQAFWSTYGPHVTSGSPNPSIGLAISGGVDSMALAYLCSRLRDQNYSDYTYAVAEEFNEPGTSSKKRNSAAYHAAVKECRFQAFVVDHGVRKGSDKEASLVADMLGKLKIPTEVLKITWPGDTSPVGKPNFESLARKYRFQALGRACQKHGIYSLLLAHHEDDQAETVLMRMLQGHRGHGLAGIEPSGEIPECHGLYGVHQSGNMEFPLSQYVGGVTVPKLVERGGVRVYRPLLTFNKASLKATCEENNVGWFEDHTNADPTLTKRNAIRHIYNNYNVPRALSKRSILSLSRRLREKVTSRTELADRWFARISKLSVGQHAGTLTIHFPKDLTAEKNEAITGSDYPKVAALLLRKAIMIVSPQENVRLSALSGAVARVFPELCKTSEEPDATALERTEFTVGGVKFSPKVKSTAAASEGNENQPTQAEDQGDLIREWFLCRQPHFPLPEDQPHITVPAGYSSIEALEPEAESETKNSANYWTLPWTLYDNRFWIRIHNPLCTPLHIRPFQPSDNKPLQHILLSMKGRGKLFKIQSKLSSLVPGKLRWTIPAVALEIQEGVERVISLPTLQVQVDDHVVCQVRYRHIDLPSSFKVSSMDLEN